MHSCKWRREKRGGEGRELSKPLWRQDLVHLRRDRNISHHFHIDAIRFLQSGHHGAFVEARTDQMSCDLIGRRVAQPGLDPQALVDEDDGLGDLLLVG